MEVTPTARSEVRKGKTRDGKGAPGRANEGPSEVYDFPEVRQSIISTAENLTHLENGVEEIQSRPLLLP